MLLPSECAEDESDVPSVTMSVVVVAELVLLKTNCPVAKLQRTLEGRLRHDKEMVPANPPTGVSVTCAVALEPLVTVSEEGFTLILNPGARALTVTGDEVEVAKFVLWA